MHEIFEPASRELTWIGGDQAHALAKQVLGSGSHGIGLEQYIGIEPGGDPKNMAAGDVISTTQSAVVLENLISQFLFSKAAEGEKSK